MKYSIDFKHTLKKYTQHNAWHSLNGSSLHFTGMFCVLIDLMQVNVLDKL